jgi:hypothetical protein
MRQRELQTDKYETENYRLIKMRLLQADKNEIENTLTNMIFRELG